MARPAETMRKIKLTIEFDGAPFEGWQVQKRGARTVQGELEAALARLLKHEVKVLGAGRTDTGVHALGMTAHLETTNRMPVIKMPVAVRKFLPPEIAVVAAEEVPPEFDARRDAVLRWYRYQIVLDETPHPLGPRVWRVFGPLDRTKMERALRHLQGRHDFCGFRVRECTAKRTLLDMEQATLTVAESVLAIDFKCRSFLQRMVRLMVGAVVAAGRGKLTMKQLDEVLRTGVRPETIESAPPDGLCLMAVAYTEEERVKLLTHTPLPPSF